MSLCQILSIGGQIVIFDGYSVYTGEPYQAVIVKPDVSYHGRKYCLMQGQSLFWAPYPEKEFWDKDKVSCPFADGNMLYRLDGMFDSSPKAMKFLDMFGYLMPYEDYRLFLPNGAMLREYPVIKQAMQDEITKNVGYLYLTSYGDDVSYCSTSGTEEHMSYEESMSAPLGFAPVFLIDEQTVKKAEKDIYGRPVIRKWNAGSLGSLFSCLA